ncbi:hypothetical protein B9479_005320 [Cryptococcus floricola]|uniref:TLC domain-containing protein n=1 Tax=Cryptococcus floricola TaxID=2591691 RepID=A0A5D3AW46_9TREE|nr:hypothetical protein B9479_005320 [Cryptococcus floricola]
MAYNLTTSTIPSMISAYLPPSLHPFLLLSYPLPPSGELLLEPLANGSSSFSSSGTLYGKGPLDAYFVLFWAVAFTALRWATIHYLFSPIARLLLPRLKAIKGQEREWNRAERKREHVVLRFAEQGWSWLYCTVFWSFGYYVLTRFPNPTSPEQLWGTYPFRPLPGSLKFYYLAQLGWWFHQLLVINFEKRRKDHWQMFGHHILTIVLVVASYAMNFTRVGVLIHCLMDFCDILLPFAKMLRYMGCTTACDLAFVVFLVSWFLTRQVGLFLVILTTYRDGPAYIPHIWAPEKGMYFTHNAYVGFVALLSTLWCLATAWFYMACVVAIRVVRGLGAEDSRSEEDEDESVEGEEVLEDVPQVVGTSSAVEQDGDARKRR